MIYQSIIIIFCLLTTGCAAHTHHKKNNLIDLDEDISLTETLIPLKKESDDVHIQFLEEMLTYKNLSTMGTEIAIQMGAQEGASLANAHITTQGQMLSEKISRDSKSIQTSMQSFQNKAQTEQQKKLQSVVTAFSDAQKDMQTQITQAATISNLELDYLYKNISIDQPQQNYIFNQIQFDQLFTLGTMLTPAGGLWKNPFSVGDWEFDKDTNSFWQYQSSPIFNSSIDDNGNTTSSSLQAENNAIFTQYYTNDTQYMIAGTITIYRIDFPAFVGIIFNKSRWISGDFQSIRKSRLIGIYANSATDINVYGTEQYTLNDDQIKTDPNADPIQTPLQQIINKKASPKVRLSPTIFSNIANKPVTCDFMITNSLTRVNCTLVFKDQEPITFTVDHLDPTLYMYHGIGFISPGAISQFSLRQPEVLVFNDEALLNFKD